MLSDQTGPIPVNIGSVLEHITEKVLFSASPALLPNFFAYSSATALQSEPLVKSRKQEYLSSGPPLFLFPKLMGERDLAKSVFKKNLVL